MGRRPRPRLRQEQYLRNAHGLRGVTRLRRRGDCVSGELMADPTTQVAIVGGGPVGLVLALFLDFHGVKCTLFNTEPAERWHPRATVRTRAPWSTTAGSASPTISGGLGFPAIIPSTRPISRA